MEVTAANDRAYDSEYDMEMYIGEYSWYAVALKSRVSWLTTRDTLYVPPVLSKVLDDRSGRL